MRDRNSTLGVAAITALIKRSSVGFEKPSKRKAIRDRKRREAQEEAERWIENVKKRKP